MCIFKGEKFPLFTLNDFFFKFVQTYLVMVLLALLAPKIHIKCKYNLIEIKF